MHRPPIAPALALLGWVSATLIAVSAASAAALSAPPSRAVAAPAAAPRAQASAPQSMTITPTLGAVTAGNFIVLAAEVRDAANNVITTTETVTWLASSGSIVPNGTTTRTTTFTGGPAGTAWITATFTNVSGTITSTAAVAVSPGAVTTLTIAPSAAALTSGGSTTFVATARDIANNVVTGGTVTWAASSGAVSGSGAGARTGTFTASLAGTTAITATLGSVNGTASATVSPGGPAVVQLTASPTSLTAGNTAFITATVRDAAGNLITTGSVTWAASRAGIIAGGTSARTTTFNGTLAGPVWITGTLAPAAGSASITVLAAAPNAITVTPNPGSLSAGSTLPFAAVVRDAFNNVVTTGQVNWASSSGTIAGAGAGRRTGNFTGEAAGTAWITATLGAVNGNATALVAPGAPAQVTIDPSSTTLTPLGAANFTAQLRDAFGNAIPGASYAWFASAGAITPSGPGAATASYQASAAAGEYPDAVRATASGFDGFASVVVNAGAPARIEVQPGSVSLQPRGTTVFSARAYDAQNNVIWPFAVNWSAFGTGVITPTGIATATFEAGTLVGAYPAAVRANVGALAGTADVNVTPGPVAQVSLSPELIVLPVGQAQAVSASGRDAYGNAVSAAYTWSVVPPTAGSFDATAATSAVLRAGGVPGAYNQAVRAQSGAVVGTADLVVQTGTATTVAIAPANATLPIGSVQLFSASVTDAFGNPVPGPGVLWQSDIGTVQSSGPYTALVKIGTQAGGFPNGVRAFFGPVSGSAAVAVPADPASTFSIAATPDAITTDGVSAAAITVQVTDQYGNAVGAGTPVSLEVTECAGTCQLSASNAATDAAGRVVATLRSDHRSASAPLSSRITVLAMMQGAGGPVTKPVEVIGTFTPYRSALPISWRSFPIDNHTACTALVLLPPDSATQAADRLFSIYRLQATTTSYTVIVRNFAPPGQLLLYRIVEDNCATTNTMTVTFVPSAVPIASQVLFQTTLAGMFIPGQDYLLAVNVTGAGSSQRYQITVQP